MLNAHTITHLIKYKYTFTHTHTLSVHSTTLNSESQIWHVRWKIDKWHLLKPHLEGKLSKWNVLIQ